MVASCVCCQGDQLVDIATASNSAFSAVNHTVTCCEVPPSFVGCLRPFNVSAFKFSEPDSSTGFVPAWEPYPYEVNPESVFESVEIALAVNDALMWTLVHERNLELLERIVWPHELLLQLYASCPFLLLAAALSDALALFHLAGDVCHVLCRRAVAIAIRLARSSFFERATKNASSSDALNAIMGARWPRLLALPQQAWALAGCLGGLTLTKLLTEPPSVRDVECVAAGGYGRLQAFSPREFFMEPRPSPSRLFREMYAQFLLRPTSFWSPCHHSVLSVALSDHLATVESLTNSFLLEFGVAGLAATLNKIARHARTVWSNHGKNVSYPLVFGFDSFKGLPRDWQHLRAGAFATVGNQLPPVEMNARLVVGWFNDTVGTFLREQTVDRAGGLSARAPTVALAHLDADLYESTKHVLHALLPHLRHGSVLVFDDLLDIQSGGGVKQNWNALYEALQSPLWSWRLEVVAAPWHLAHESVQRGCSAVAFRLHQD